MAGNTEWVAALARVRAAIAGNGRDGLLTARDVAFQSTMELDPRAAGAEIHDPAHGELLKLQSDLDRRIVDLDGPSSDELESMWSNFEDWKVNLGMGDEWAIYVLLNFAVRYVPHDSAQKALPAFCSAVAAVADLVRNERMGPEQSWD